MIDFLSRFGGAINGFVNAVRTTSWKALIPLGLDVLTFFVWAICAIQKIEIDKGAFAMWLGFLAGLGGFALASFNVERKTDYGALERQAAIEAAKAGTPPTTTTSVTSTEGSATVATTTETKPTP